LAAWHVILDLALLLAKECRAIDTLMSDEVTRVSLQVSGAELRRILEEALQIGEQDSRGIVEFFTFRPKSPDSRAHAACGRLPDPDPRRR
jgi:hypothetical protein